MNAGIMVAVVLIPILCGALIPLIPFKSRTQMAVYVECVVLINSLLVLTMLFHRPQDVFVLFRFTGNLSVSFRLDGFGTVFAAIVSVLWPLATLYSFEYMKHEGHERYFFMFYTVTYGVTLGIALAEDIMTMYFFYEMLSLVTLPLIMHTLTREAILASRTYLYYSLGGAAFAFIGMIFILTYGTTPVFTPGGVIDLARLGDRRGFLFVVYVLCFCGFSVKAAMFPFSSWLPKAGAAPTPCYGSASCGGGGKGGSVYGHACDLLQLRYGASQGNLGADGGFATVYIYDCVRLQPRVERDAPEAASCLVYSEQSVLYSVWGRIDDTSWICGGYEPYGFPCHNENLLFLLCRCSYLQNRTELYP